MTTPRLALQTSPLQILAIGMPLMGGLLFQSLIVLIEVGYVSKVGANEFAALTGSSMLYMVLVMIALSISQGAQILIARRAGEGNVKAIGTYADVALFNALIVSLGLVVIMQVGANWFMRLLISDDLVYGHSISYLRIRACGLPFTFLVLALGGFYAGIGRTMAFVWSASAMVLANIVLNHALVLGNLGLPRLGLEGSALAAVISELMACIILFGHALVMKYPKRFNFLKLRYVGGRAQRDLLLLAGPIALQQMTGSLSWFLFFILIGNEIGTNAMNASQVMRTAYLLVSVPARALGGAAETLVSNVIGQGKPDLVRSVTLRTAGIGAAFTVILLLPVIIFPENLFSRIAPDVSLNDSASDAVAQAVSALPSLCVALVLLSIGAIFFRAVTGTGAATKAWLFETVSASIYLVYAFVIIRWLNADLNFSWTSEIFYWAMLIAMSYLFLRRGKWPKLTSPETAS